MKITKPINLVCPICKKVYPTFLERVCRIKKWYCIKCLDYFKIEGNNVDKFRGLLKKTKTNVNKKRLNK